MVAAVFDFKDQGERGQVAEQVYVDEVEEQLVLDQARSYLLNCQRGEAVIVCMKRHHL